MAPVIAGALIDLRDSARDADDEPEPVRRRAEIDLHERERLTLDALGEDRLTIRELAERLNADFGGERVYESWVRNIVNRLFKARELDRTASVAAVGGSTHHCSSRPRAAVR